jgi:CheY-like chemotaxis protein
MTVVGEAPDGATAVELAQCLRPDLVLAGTRMPGLDGPEVTRLLASSPARLLAGPPARNRIGIAACVWGTGLAAPQL